MLFFLKLQNAQHVHILHPFNNINLIIFHQHKTDENEGFFHQIEGYGGATIKKLKRKHSGGKTN